MAAARHALLLEMAAAGRPYGWRPLSSRRFSAVPAVTEPGEWLVPDGPFGHSRAVTGCLEGLPVLCGLYFEPEPSLPTAESAPSDVRALLSHLWCEHPESDARLNLLVTGTPLQVAVWQALVAIPIGETRSYTEIAQAAGSPRAVRAAASAVGSNPVSWLIPCHRVIRADGSLGGFYWGLDMKRAMLGREGASF